MTSTFVASVKKRRLCPALNGGAIIFRSASFAHFIVARRDEVVDRAAARSAPCSLSPQNSLVPIPNHACAYATVAQIVREGERRGDYSGRCEAMTRIVGRFRLTPFISLLHRLGRSVGSLSVIGIVRATKRERKRGRENGGELCPIQCPIFLHLPAFQS